MFLKMFCKDLKNDKGMNGVLLLFMLVASTLMVISSISIMAFLMPDSRSHEICKNADMILRYQFADCMAKEGEEIVREYLLNREEIVSLTEAKALRLSSASQIDIEGYDEETYDVFFERMYSIEYQEFEQNLLFDIDDKPFVVEGNGIAVSEEFRDITGVELGDAIFISTDSGKVFRFEVTTFFKDIYTAQTIPLIVSNDAFQLLSEEFYYEVVKYSLHLKENVKQSEFLAVLWEDRKDTADPTHAYTLGGVVLTDMNDFFSENNTIMYIIIVFSMLSAVFMIAIILMTIRFTLVNAIENEKKELGMMKAIGTDTLGFRVLFAAKYIGFAIIAGVLGILCGFPLSKIFLKMTYKKHIFPTFLEKLTVSVFAIVLILFLIISFTLIVLRRMNKISVMEVIHGQGKGEDFEKINKFYIHKSKMPIPLYLALSDVRYQLKKYIFLMGAYVCAFLIILCTTNLRDSVYDESFMRYTLSYQFDFHPNFNEELSEYYWGKAGDSTHMLMLINEDIEKAGIPAGFEFAINTNANLYRQDGTQAAIDLMSEFDANKYIYREGEAPRLKNEIALSYATAKRSGFQIGDTVKIKYEDCTDVMATRKEIEEEFIITAFIDYMEGFSNAIAIMSNEFHNGMGNSSFIINIAIRAPEEEKPYYFAKLEELFGAENIDTLEELMEQDMGQYDLILSSIRNLLSATALLVIMLITLLYGRILLSAETTEIAALKSTGFTDAAIKRWQFCRGVLLLLFSTVIAYAVHFTLGQGFVSVAFGALDLTGFHYVIDPIKTFFVVPVMIWISVLLVLWIVQKNINKIKIWKIRED